jgi:hypothetical protein
MGALKSSIFTPRGVQKLNGNRELNPSEFPLRLWCLTVLPADFRVRFSELRAAQDPGDRGRLRVAPALQEASAGEDTRPALDPASTRHDRSAVASALDAEVASTTWRARAERMYA